MSDLIKEAMDRLNKSYLEPIEAMATIYTSHNPNYFVQVNPDGLHIGNEYFKVYFGGSNGRSATKMNRISFWRPEYIEHSYDGKEPWFLNAREKRTLINHLKADSKGSFTLDGSRKLTNWERAIVRYNEEMHHEQDETEANLLGTPSYNRQFLPFNLPMPNYLEL